MKVEVGEEEERAKPGAAEACEGRRIRRFWVWEELCANTT